MWVDERSTVHAMNSWSVAATTASTAVRASCPTLAEAGDCAMSYLSLQIKSCKKVKE
jgi:hypothetical protein